MTGAKSGLFPSLEAQRKRTDMLNNPSSAEAVENTLKENRKEYSEIIRDLVDEIVADSTLSASAKLQDVELALRANMHLFLK